MRPLQLALLLAMAAALSAQEPGAATQMVPFAIEDQFKVVHTEAEVAGHVVVLAGGDRKGNEFVDAWLGALRSRLPASGPVDQLRYVRFAHTRGAPFFVKGRIRASFPAAADRWVLLDWKGVLATAYGIEADRANLLLFDRQGRLRARAAGAALEAVALDAFAAAVAAALAE